MKSNKLFLLALTGIFNSCVSPQKLTFYRPKEHMPMNKIVVKLYPDHAKLKLVFSETKLRLFGKYIEIDNGYLINGLVRNTNDLNSEQSKLKEGKLLIRNDSCFYYNNEGALVTELRKE